MDPDVRAKFDRALSALHDLAADLMQARRDLATMRAEAQASTLDDYIDHAPTTVYLPSDDLDAEWQRHRQRQPEPSWER